MFGKKKNEVNQGFIKNKTAGTSNEISFSVLDAKTSGTPWAPVGAKPPKSPIVNKTPKATKTINSQQAKKGFGRFSLFSVFTVHGKESRKVNSTPTKDADVLLPSGTSVQLSTNAGTPMPGTLAIESSDILKNKSGRHAATGVTTTSEVARRKTRRVATQLAAIFAAILMVLGVAAFTGSFFTETSKAHQTQVQRLQLALKNVIEVDNTLVAMDKVLSSPIDMSSFDAMTEIETNATTLNEKLNEAENITNVVLGVIEDSTDRVAAEKTLEAIKARRVMLTNGLALIEHAKTAAQAVELTLDAWEEIYQVDALMKEVSSIVAAGADMDISALNTNAQTANETMVSAYEQLKAAAQLFPSADLEVQIRYASVRVSSTKAINAAANKLELGNIDEAATKLAEANEQEQQAAVLAQSLPAYPSQPIAVAYMAQTEEASQEYQEARNIAASMDAFLRNYLGR